MPVTIYAFYCLLGKISFYVSLPFLYLYGLTAKSPRTRLLFVHDNSVLIVKNWFGEQTWTLPGGGVIGIETETAALAREVHEEIGIEIDASQLIHFDTMTVQQVAPYKISIYMLKATTLPASLAIDKREITAAMWCPLHKLPKNSSSELQEIVARYSE